MDIRNQGLMKAILKMLELHFFQTIGVPDSDELRIGIPAEFESAIKPRDNVFPADLKRVTYSEAIKCIKKHMMVV